MASGVEEKLLLLVSLPTWPCLAAEPVGGSAPGVSLVAFSSHGSHSGVGSTNHFPPAPFFSIFFFQNINGDQFVRTKSTL